MRTFSLLVALAVLGCVISIVSHRPAPRPATMKKLTVTAARSSEPGKRGFEVSVAVKGQPQDEGKQELGDANDAKVVEKAVPQQEKAEPKIEPAPVAPAADKGRTPAGVVDISEGKVIGWRITGEYQTTLEDATQRALTLAKATVHRYLRNQEPPINWVPPLNFVHMRLVKNLTNELADFGGSVGPMHRVILDVKLTPEALREIVQQDREQGRQMVQREREEQAKARMLWLGKILLALVALLAAVAGYIRLDDMTKGYLSHWMRLAVFFVGAVLVLGLLLIA
jgi:hypothetical protein